MRAIDLELHDGIIKNMTIDYEKNTIDFFLEVYLTKADRQRNGLIIRFSDVESISKIIDFKSLKKNCFAGNVNYWIPAECEGGTTYIYLSDGCIAVKSECVQVEIMDSNLKKEVNGTYL